MKYMVMFLTFLSTLTETSIAAPSLDYSTIVHEDAFYDYDLADGIQGLYAADVGSDGYFYIGVPVTHPNSDNRGIIIYRINPYGTEVEIITTIAGYGVCYNLIWSETGIYAHCGYPARMQVIKIDFDGSIIFTAEAYSGNHPTFVDNMNNLYIVADVDSFALFHDDVHVPITDNAFDSSYNGNSDLVIKKYDSEGNLLFGSFLGGPLNDYISDITVDDEGRLYISGQASFDIEIKGESQTIDVNPGVMVLSPGLDEISALDMFLWSPLMAMHVYNEELYNITTSSINKYPLNGGEVIWTLNLSDEIPVFTWPRQKPAGHASNKMLTAFIDDQNCFYSVHFKAASAPFTTTSDALFPEPNASYIDLGIWQVSDNAELLYGTYFGGRYIDESTRNAVAFREGKLYVAGYTNSPDFPLTSGSYIDGRPAPVYGQDYPWGLFAFCIDFNEPTEVADESSAIPEALILDPPHPNPFNPATTISFTLPEAGFARLAIYNISGQLVRELTAENLPAGRHELVWDGRDMNGAMSGSGVYIARLAAGDRTAVRKVTLVR